MADQSTVLSDNVGVSDPDPANVADRIAPPVAPPTPPAAPAPRRRRAPAAEPEAPKGKKLWCAYHPDGSDFAVFGREQDALRHAVNESMKVKPIDYGVSVMAQIRQP